MAGYSLDTNIVVDALWGYEPAFREISRISSTGARMWISRMAWIEALSKGNDAAVQESSLFLARFGLDEIDSEIAQRAAGLRRERPQLRTPDAIILATAMIRGRVLVTRNTKDFPAEMPGIRIPYSL